jgi:hypothetical protein
MRSGGWSASFNAKTASFSARMAAAAKAHEAAYWARVEARRSRMPWFFKYELLYDLHIEHERTWYITRPGWRESYAAHDAAETAVEADGSASRWWAAAAAYDDAAAAAAAGEDNGSAARWWMSAAACRLEAWEAWKVAEKASIDGAVDVD